MKVDVECTELEVELEVLEDEVLVVEGLVDVVLVVVLVEGVEVLGKKMKYPAATIRTMTITAVTTTAAPIPDFSCSVFIPYVFLRVPPCVLDLRLSNHWSSRFTPPARFP